MRKDKRKAITILLCMMFATLANTQAVASGPHKLWYDRPAQNWNEALPIGNGRLGAMVFGNVAAERLQLNEETIWAGRPNNNANPDALEYLPKVRQLVWEGKYKEAQDMATQHVQSNTNHGMPYQPFGDLYIHFPGQGDYSNYCRELSLDSAVATTRYTIDGVIYQREYIASFSGNVIAVRLSANRKGAITCNAILTSPHADVAISSEGSEIVLSGTTSNHEGLKGKVTFTGRLTATAKGGRITSKDGVLSITGADDAIIYVAIATNFKHYDDISGNDTILSENILREALQQDYGTMRDRHVTHYKKYFDRPSRQPSCGNLFPVWQIPPHLHLARGLPAPHTARHMERQDVSQLGFQIHHEHQLRDELLASGGHQPLRPERPPLLTHP